MPLVSDDVWFRMSLSASLSLPDLTFLSHRNLIPFGQGFHFFLCSFTVVDTDVVSIVFFVFFTVFLLLFLKILLLLLMLLF